MARGWALRVLGCLAAATVLVTGCAAEHEPKAAAPTTSAKASPTLPPLGPADFPVPAEARQKTEAGALAFTHYYMELTNHLASSLNAGPLREFSRNCATCDQLADSYDKDKAAGYRYQGGDVSISSTGSVLLTGDRAEIPFVLEQTAVTVYDSVGKMVPSKSSSGYRLTGGIGLTWDGSRNTWVVYQLDAERV